MWHALVAGHCIVASDLFLFTSITRLYSAINSIITIFIRGICLCWLRHVLDKYKNELRYFRKFQKSGVDAPLHSLKTVWVINCLGVIEYQNSYLQFKSTRLCVWWKNISTYIKIYIVLFFALYTARSTMNCIFCDITPMLQIRNATRTLTGWAFIYRGCCDWLWCYCHEWSSEEMTASTLAHHIYCLNKELFPV